MPPSIGVETLKCCADMRRGVAHDAIVIPVG
jgi:hypothetical protein